MFNFFGTTESSLLCCARGNTMTCGDGIGLEVPDDYKLYETKKALESIAKKLHEVDKATYM